MMLEKEKQTKPKTRRRKKIINIRKEISEIETRTIIEKHQCSQNLGLWNDQQNWQIFCSTDQKKKKKKKKKDLNF